MNILVINYEFPPLGGGASPISYDIAKGYALQGHRVDVITMHFTGLPYYAIEKGMHIHRVKCIRKKKELCTPFEMLSFLRPAYAKAMKLTKERTYNINHTHFIIPSGIVSLCLRLRKKIPYIITSHGSDVPGFNTDRFQVLHLFTKPLLYAITKKAKVIISPSIYLQELIKKNISKQCTVQVIPNGIDTTIFTPATHKKNIILSTGRLLQRKGFQHIIKAVSDRDIGWVVHIAGDGPYKQELEELAKQSKTKIVFHGWISKNEIQQLYADAKIFILASEKENASISLLEGLSSGCAVITTNVSGCPETVGKAGVLVNFGDVLGIQEAITTLIKDNVQRRKQSRTRAEIFSISKIQKKYMDVLTYET